MASKGMRTSGNGGRGMNWIRQEKRLAIYLRDGLACAWCGQAVEDGVRLTLDHLTPRSKGGRNDERNLVTSCGRCNSSRADRSVRVFARGLAAYLNHGVRAEQIVAHVRETSRRPLDLPAAKALMALRGSLAEAVR